MSDKRDTTTGAGDARDHVYQHEAGYYVVAASPQEAVFFYRRHQEEVVGEDPSEWPELLDPAQWTPMDDDELFTFDYQGPIPEGQQPPAGAVREAAQGCVKATAPASCWAQTRGAGFFATEHL